MLHPLAPSRAPPETSSGRSRSNSKCESYSIMFECSSLTSCTLRRIADSQLSNDGAPPSAEHKPHALNIGYEAPQTRFSGEQTTLWQLGSNTLDGWAKSSTTLIEAGGDLDGICSLVVLQTRSGQIDLRARYLLKRLTLPVELLVSSNWLRLYSLSR